MIGFCSRGEVPSGNLVCMYVYTVKGEGVSQVFIRFPSPPPPRPGVGVGVGRVEWVGWGS